MKIIKYFIVLTIIIFYIKAECLAGPIPVFELFGWKEDKNATIDEYDSDGRTQLKVYKL